MAAPSENNNAYSSPTTGQVPVVRHPFFRRRKACPLQDIPESDINYKNVALLQRFVSERGRIIPSRITAVSAKKQRFLTRAIKRARQLALLPFVAQ